MAKPAKDNAAVLGARTTARSAALTVLFMLTPLLSGCLFEASMDRTVYFNNTTDQTLYLRRRDQLGALEKYALVIDANGTSKGPLVGREKCLDIWVITTKYGTVVKDPGRICWHDTVTIP